MIPFLEDLEEEKRPEDSKPSGAPADKSDELELPDRSPPPDVNELSSRVEPPGPSSRNIDRSSSSSSSSRRSRSSSPRRRPRENQVVSILGKKGQGKTTYALGIFRARVESGGSAIWIDRTGKAGSDLEATGHARKVTTVRGFELELLAALEQERPIRVAVTLGWGEDHNPLWRRIYEYGRTLLVLDDPSSFMKHNRIDPDLEELVELSRNQEVDIVTTVRRPPELHGSLKSQTDVAVSFRQGTPHYARVVRETFFHEPGVEELLLELPRFHYLRADAEGRITRGRVSV